MSEHAREDTAAETPAVREPAFAGPGAAGLLPGAGPLRPARVLGLQRAIGNAATTRLLQREGKLPTAAPPARPVAVPAAETVAQDDEFKPFVPVNNVDQLFRAGADAIRKAKWKVDHIAVIAGAVYVAKPDGQRTGNFALKGNFGLQPGAYVIDGGGTAQFGFRNGKLVHRRIGWRTQDLPAEIRKRSDERDKANKAAGKTGATIFLHDWIDISEEQERTQFGNVLIFVPEPKPPDPAEADGQKGYGAGQTGTPESGKDTKPPALAEPGYGVDFGREGGKRADLPPFPARIRPMGSMRGGVVKRPEGDERDALPFVYQPTRGAAVYQMLIDYTSASPGFLLGQASAASRLHAYKWEVWDISASHEAALAEAADTAGKGRPGAGSRTVGKTDAAYEDLDRATEDLAKRPDQYRADQKRAVAEGRYFDALANDLNQELFGLEVMFRYGKELTGLAADQMETGRERRIPIPNEGVYLVRCIARYDPYAASQGRPTRAPSKATMIVKVKSRDWLSRDALSEDEAAIAGVELDIAWTRAALKQAKAAGADSAALEAQLTALESRLAAATSRARDLPVAMLEQELADKEAKLTAAQKASSLYQAGYGSYDTTVTGLTKEVQGLRDQLGHARVQVADLKGGDPARAIHRVKGHLVSRVTGQTYPMLLQVNDPRQDAGGTWTCRMADSTSRRGKYYDGTGTSAILAFRNAVDALAGDNLEGYGEGSLAVRVPAAGKFADLSELERTHERDTVTRDWAAARSRLDELAVVLGALAIVAVPGVGEAAMVLGAALAAARIIDRLQNDTLFWDGELVSDIISILSTAASGVAAVGKLRIVKHAGKFVIVPAEEASRMARIAKFAQRANDWFLDPANIAWGNITLLEQLKDLADQEARGGLTATEARRQRATLMANAINTNLALVGKVTGAAHEADQMFEKGKPKAKGGEPPPEPAPPKRRPGEEPPPRRTPADEHPPAPKDEHAGPVAPPIVPEPPKRPVEEVPARPAFRAALETSTGLPVAEAHRVLLEVGDWKGELRRVVATLPEAHQARAREALAEARQRLVREITDEAAAAFGADQRNYGTPGFGSDIDLTITPKERLPGFTGTERPIADQIRAAADAAEFINRRLREKLGAEPDRAIDTNVYSYIAEDRVRLDTPELRARAGALEAEIGLAEARRGVDAATWAALEGAIADKLKTGDPVERRALADLKARMEAGVATERAMRAESERVQATLREANVPEAQIPAQARDAILSEKKRQLAELFEAKPPDMIRILRLQAEIRWFAPDAYASGAAFEYTVGFGQARRSAGADAAEQAGRATPTQADVLADLAANWAKDVSRPEEQRMALYAAGAAAQLGMLGAHAHGAPPDQVKAAAKYAARILDLLGYSRLGGTEGTIPTALANFVRGRMPDATERVRIQMLVQYAMDVGMYGGILRGPDGKPTGVSEAVMNRFVADVKVWAIDATARLLVGERTHSGAVADPAAAPAAAGGLRGRSYELGNEYTYTDKAGVAQTAGGLERSKGPEKVSSAMARLGKSVDAGATVTAVAKHGLDFVVSVPGPGGSGAPTSVAVEVVIRKTGDLTPSAHGEEGGPARLIPTATKDASGALTWRARIEVDSRLLERDLPHVLRHEVNELVGLVRMHPGGEPPHGWSSQMSAAVMKPGAAPGPVLPTVHDRAAVLELKGLYDDLAKQKPGTDAFDARADSIERAREAMGLGEATNAREKLRMLMEAGVPAEEIGRVAETAGTALADAHRASEAAAGRPGTVFDNALAAKTLIPRAFGDFRSKGLNGGHVTAHLIDFCAFSVYHVREVGHPRDAGGTRWRRFEQWKWLGTVADKPTHADFLPGGSQFDASRWQLSEQPKTTADDAAAFLREADSAWRWWFARHNGADGSLDDAAVSGGARAFGGPNGTETARSAGGVEFGGFYDAGVDSATVRTIFPDVSWLP